MPFLNGVETTRILKGPQPVITAPTAVIGLIGAAPMQLVLADNRSLNVPVVCRSADDDVKFFGPDTAGYSIPESLQLIRAQHPHAVVVVINVFDHATMLTTGQPDPALVLSSHITGTVSVGGVRSGLQAFLNARSLFGFSPRLLIAPRYSTAAAVVTGLAAVLPKLRARAIVDAPAGTTVAAAITARGVGGSLNLNISNGDIDLAHGWWKMPVGSTTRLVPYSAILAGINSRVHAEVGYHAGLSNQPIRGVVGPEAILYTSHNDPGADNQALNAAGLYSHLAAYGGLLNTWGNRTSTYPTNVAIDSFSCVRTTAAIIEDTIEEAALPYLGKSLDRPLVDYITAQVNTKLRAERSAKRLIDGICYLDPEANSVSELAAGHATWAYEFVSPTPLERASFKSVINTEMLAAVLAA